MIAFEPKVVKILDLKPGDVISIEHGDYGNFVIVVVTKITELDESWIRIEGYYANNKNREFVGNTPTYRGVPTCTLIGTEEIENGNC